MASLLKRIRDLISANINAMLDSAEDPEKMVNEYLRQMQDELYEAKTTVAAAMADEDKINRMWASNQALAEEWQKKAEAALQAGKEDLAKQALMRRRAYQELAENYRQQFETQSQQVEELQDALAKLEAKIAEARARRPGRARRRPPGQSQGDGQARGPGPRNPPHRCRAGSGRRGRSARIEEKDGPGILV